MRSVPVQTERLRVIVALPWLRAEARSVPPVRRDCVRSRWHASAGRWRGGLPDRRPPRSRGCRGRPRVPRQGEFTAGVTSAAVGDVTIPRASPTPPTDETLPGGAFDLVRKPDSRWRRPVSLRRTVVI
jgi:hypothetical protein